MRMRCFTVIILGLSMNVAWAEKTCPTKVAHQIYELEKDLIMLDSSQDYAVGKTESTSKSFCWWVGQADIEVSGISAKTAALNTSTATTTQDVDQSIATIRVNSALLDAFCKSNIVKYGSEQDEATDRLFASVRKLETLFRQDDCTAIFR
jgi:hypothetical protein